MLMTNELPEDLVAQILVWLPVVSLLRLKCVCKSWYALITHKNFIAKHLLHNKNSNTHILLQTRDKATEDYVVSMLSYETLQVSHTKPLPPPYFEIDKKFVPPPIHGFHLKVDIVVVGSCNGIVCLHDNYGLNIVLWNPATRETKVVPESKLLRCPVGYLVYFNGIGFGFDAKTNDYKIINLRHTMPDLTIPYSRIQCIFQRKEKERGGQTTPATPCLKKKKKKKSIHEGHGKEREEELVLYRECSVRKKQSSGLKEQEEEMASFSASMHDREVDGQESERQGRSLPKLRGGF
jgi:hypothetical protein